jgi:APA family basic amino acid/polyamine antiporter
MGFFDRKSMAEYTAQRNSPREGMQRILGAWQLTALGIGATVGSGIFVITGVVAALHAGPAILISFVIAGLGCLFAALCYAELAAMIPVSGSAYSYAYATMGKGIAWIIGWSLVLEYLFSSATAAVGWSGYFASSLEQLGWTIPEALRTGPITMDESFNIVRTGALINLPAMLLIGVLSAILVVGVSQSSAVNAVMVVLKIGIVALFVIVGAAHVDVAHWTPFIPDNTGTFGQFGWSGILRGAGMVFIAYLGFDAISTAAQETRNPGRNIPIGILASLFVCTLLYMATAATLTGLTSYTNLNVPNPIFVATDAAGAELAWLKPIINVGALIGLASVTFVLLYAQPRIFHTMGSDGMISSAFARLHSKYRTPHFGIAVTGLCSAVLAGLFPLSILGEMVSIGTLFAFTIVCAGVWVMRVRHPEIPRSFRTPWVPLVPILGILTCSYMMVSLPAGTWLRLILWLALGMVIYYVMERRQKLRTTQLAQRLMPVLVLVVTACLAAPLVHADVDSKMSSPQLKELEAAVAAGDRAATEGFWRSIEQSRAPLIEQIEGAVDMLVTFLWRALPEQEAVNVRVYSDGLTPYEQAGDALQRLGKTDVWYRTYRVPRNARFVYYLAWPQGAVPRSDSLQRITAENGLVYETLADPLARWNYVQERDQVRKLFSYAEGSDAPAQPYIAVREGVPRGSVETIEVDSKILGNQRKVSIYTPPGYRAKGSTYGLLLLFDRRSYLSDVPTPTILDNMQAEKAIPPMVAVLVDSRVTNDPDGDARSRELPPNPKFQRFLREELVPLIRARYNVSTDPKRNVVAGSSYGGLAAAFTGLSSPDVFGNVVSQSGSYWWNPECCRSRDADMVFLSEDAGWLVKEFAAAPRKPLRFYMDVGLWETADMLLPNRILRSVLEGKGYEVTYREFTGGHDYVNWRGTLSDGLIAVIGTQKAKAQRATSESK